LEIPASKNPLHKPPRNFSLSLIVGIWKGQIRIRAATSFCKYTFSSPFLHFSSRATKTSHPRFRKSKIGKSKKVSTIFRSTLPLANHYFHYLQRFINSSLQDSKKLQILQVMVASHVYGSFGKWYMAKLKVAPFLTNLSTGVVLMTGSDVLVQKVESRQSPASSVEDAPCSCDSMEAKAVHRSLDAEHEIIGACTEDDLLIYATDAIVGARLLDRHEAIVDSIKDQFSFWNPFRTGTMASWAFFYVPFYATVYKAYDRYLPKKTPAGILARVALSFATSVPVNAAFYSYGTTVEHTQAWYAKLRKSQQQPEGSTASAVPYRFDQLWDKLSWKLQNELPTTIQASATCWMPFNVVMFSVIPSHMQPLSLMVFSFFWNCYLSMSQHRSSLAASSLVQEKEGEESRL
jgi:Mpv17 / PMP22 family